MIGFLSTILVFIVLDYLAETFLKKIKELTIISGGMVLGMTLEIQQEVIKSLLEQKMKILRDLDISSV